MAAEHALLGPLRATEQLRADAARRFAFDEELEDIERELRQDMHRGANPGQSGFLLWDTRRREREPRLHAALADPDGSPPASPSGHCVAEARSLGPEDGLAPVALGAARQHVRCVLADMTACGGCLDGDALEVVRANARRCVEVMGDRPPDGQALQAARSHARRVLEDMSISSGRLEGESLDSARESAKLCLKLLSEKPLNVPIMEVAQHHIRRALTHMLPSDGRLEGPALEAARADARRCLETLGDKPLDVQSTMAAKIHAQNLLADVAGGGMRLEGQSLKAACVHARCCLESMGDSSLSPGPLEVARQHIRRVIEDMATSHGRLEGAYLDAACLHARQCLEVMSDRALDLQSLDTARMHARLVLEEVSSGELEGGTLEAARTRARRCLEAMGDTSYSSQPIEAACAHARRLLENMAASSGRLEGEALEAARAHARRCLEAMNLSPEDDAAPQADGQPLSLDVARAHARCVLEDMSIVQNGCALDGRELEVARAKARRCLESMFPYGGALDSDELAAQCRAVIRGLPSGKRVCVLGPRQISHPCTQGLVQAIACQLPGSKESGQSIVVLTAGQPGVQELFAQSLGGFPALVHLMPRGVASCFGTGQDVACGATVDERAEIFCRLGDIYLVIADGSCCDPEVGREAAKAVNAGALVLPIGRPDGQQGFPAVALERPAGITKAQWASLQEDGSPEIVARAVAEIVASRTSCSAH